MHKASFFEKSGNQFVLSVELKDGKRMETQKILNRKILQNTSLNSTDSIVLVTVLCILTIYVQFF